MKPSASIVGNVPIQNTNMISDACTVSAEAKASPTNPYNQPHGSNVVITPIANGRKRLGTTVNFLMHLPSEEPKSATSLFETGNCTPRSLYIPANIRVTPTMSAESLEIELAPSIDRPIQAAEIPSVKYVSKRPKLYSRWGIA